MLEKIVSNPKEEAFLFNDLDYDRIVTILKNSFNSGDHSFIDTNSQF